MSDAAPRIGKYRMCAECAMCGAGHADYCPDHPVRDRHGDVWTLGADGLMHSFETASFPRSHIEKKWGPLVPERELE